LECAQEKVLTDKRVNIDKKWSKFRVWQFFSNSTVDRACVRACAWDTTFQ